MTRQGTPTCHTLPPLRSCCLSKPRKYEGYNENEGNMKRQQKSKIHNERELMTTGPSLSRNWRGTSKIGVISHSIKHMLQRFPSSIFQRITFPFNQEMGSFGTMYIIRTMLQNRTHKEFLLTINNNGLGWNMMSIMRMEWSQLAHMEHIMALPMSRKIKYIVQSRIPNLKNTERTIEFRLELASLVRCRGWFQAIRR